jgi:hypothetical protein
VKEICALVAGALGLLGFTGGVMVGSHYSSKALAKLEAEVATAKKVQEVELQRLMDYSQQLEAQLKQRNVQIRTVTKEIVREIPKLVGDGVCINPGWVRVHDAAAAGVSIGSGEFVGPAPDVTAARAAEVVAQNYGECLVWREQVLGWQKWHGEESESKKRINSILRAQ